MPYKHGPRAARMEIPVETDPMVIFRVAGEAAEEIDAIGGASLHVQTHDGREEAEQGGQVEEDEDAGLQREGSQRRDGDDGRREEGTRVAHRTQQDADPAPFQHLSRLLLQRNSCIAPNSEIVIHSVDFFFFFLDIWDFFEFEFSCFWQFFQLFLLNFRILVIFFKCFFFNLMNCLN